MRHVSYLGHDVQILSNEMGAEIYIDSLDIKLELADPDLGRAVMTARKLIDIYRS
jgi:hypothetical protein